MFPLVKVSASKYLYMLKSMCTFSLLIYMDSVTVSTINLEKFFFGLHSPISPFLGIFKFNLYMYKIMFHYEIFHTYI